MRRTIGASIARSGNHFSTIVRSIANLTLTLALRVCLIDTRADNHHIVDDCKAALAAHPLPIPAFHPTVCQHSRLILHDRLLLEVPCIWNLFRDKVLPGRVVDNLIRRVSENIDDRVGGVEDAGFIIETYVFVSRRTTTVIRDGDAYCELI